MKSTIIQNAATYVLEHGLADSSKSKRRFPGFEVTTHAQGLELIRREWANQRAAARA